MILSKTVQKKQFAPKLYSHHTVAYIFLRCFAFPRFYKSKGLYYGFHEEIWFKPKLLL